MNFQGLAYNAKKNLLYVADTENHALRYLIFLFVSKVLLPIWHIKTIILSELSKPHLQLKSQEFGNHDQSISAILLIVNIVNLFLRNVSINVGRLILLMSQCVHLLVMEPKALTI